MIHVVDATNRHLYARQLGEMRTLARRPFETDAAWLMALGPAEELTGHLWLCPAEGGHWEVSDIWVDAGPGASHAGLHRLLAAAAERALRARGRALKIAIDAPAYALFAGGVLDLRISGPPLFSDEGAVLTLGCELAGASLGALLDSLGEPGPLTYVVDDEDLAIYGDLAALQCEVDRARDVDIDQVKIDQGAPTATTAWIQARFVRCDAYAAAQDEIS